MCTQAMREVARPCHFFSGPVVDQPNCPRTPPGVGTPLRAVGRPGRRHPKMEQGLVRASQGAGGHPNHPMGERGTSELGRNIGHVGWV